MHSRALVAQDTANFEPEEACVRVYESRSNPSVASVAVD
jgi:hypothetical protein